MKKCILMCVVMAMTLTATAQNTWEEPEKKEEKVAVVETNPMEKYLKGAVPEVNGKVTFTKTFDAPGKTAFQIYNILGKYLQGVTRGPQQINSQLIKADTATYEIDVKLEEWLVFQKTALVLDQTRFFYTIKAQCANGKATLTLSNIRYNYDEERTPIRISAEDWISDRVAVNKKNTKLYRHSGKFRKCTIDRKDYLFEQIEGLLQ